MKDFIYSQAVHCLIFYLDDDEDDDEDDDDDEEDDDEDDEEDEDGDEPTPLKKQVS